MRITVVIFAGLLTLCSWGAASANPLGTKAEAVAMVRLVQQDFKQNGPAKTFKDIDDKTNKDFHKGDLYPFVFAFDGTCVAHGASAALIGKDLIGLKDPDGKFLIRDMAMLSQKGDGWYNYKWPNPITKKIEDKSSFYAKLGSKYFVGVGVYRAAK